MKRFWLPNKEQVFKAGCDIRAETHPVYMARGAAPFVLIDDKLVTWML